MAPARFLTAVIASAAVGLVAITVYLVVERAVADHLSVTLCLKQLLQWDASNAYGSSAFEGGWPMALIGLGMDCIVAFCWAVAFVLLYVSIPISRRHVALAGLGFGVLVMVVMIFGIVPLGHAAQLPRTPSHVINVLVAHAIFFGLLLALTVRAVAG